MQTLNLSSQPTPFGRSSPTLGLSAWYDFPGSFGVLGSIAYTYSARQKPIIHSAGTIRKKVIAWAIGADLGFYHYPFNQSGGVVGGTLVRTRSSDKRFSIGSRCGAGLWRTFYAGGLYSLNAQGQVSRSSFGGRLYGYIQLGIPLTWSLKPWRSIALKVEPLLWIQFPYNSFILPHPSLTVGLTRSFQQAQPGKGNHSGNR